MSEGYVCTECGLDYETLGPTELGAHVRSVGSGLSARLSACDDRVVRTRPTRTTWSAIEYAAHLADVYDAFVEIVRRMRAGIGFEDGFFWDPDERAAEQRYADQPHAATVAALEKHAARLAAALEEVPPADWSVVAQFPWGERDLLTTGRNAVHEGVHHDRDVEQVLRKVSAAGA